MSECDDKKKSSDQLIDIGVGFLVTSFGLAFGNAALFGMKGDSTMAKVSAAAALVFAIIAIAVVATGFPARDCSAAALAANKSDPGVKPMAVLLVGVASFISMLGVTYQNYKYSPKL